jgi:hypothetical protein
LLIGTIISSWPALEGLAYAQGLSAEHHKIYKKPANRFHIDVEDADEIFRLSKTMYLKKLKIHNGICKVCALVVAALILPALAYADHDSGKSNKGDDEHRWGAHDTDRDRDKNISVVPEANAGWVLIPFFGAVLLFSARQFFRAKA